MLKLAGEGIIAEVIERLGYSPGLQDSGDLELATRTIIATAEAVGLANRDYQVALTLPSPPDARLTVLRIAARLAGTIDSMTAGQLNCRVYVDAQDADHRLFDLSWTTIGAKLAVVDTHAGNLATIFNLLKDGAAHTFYFFFWVDAGNAVLSLCQLWEGVGASDTTGWGQQVLQLTFTGILRVSSNVARVGTGAIVHHLLGPGGNTDRLKDSMMNNDVVPNSIFSGTCYWNIGGSVATDLNYLNQVYIYLRSEQ